MKKLIAVILSVAMLIAILAGCTKDSEDNGDSSENTDPTEITDPSNDIDINYGDSPNFEAVYAAFPPDTPMVIIDDSVVTWEELFANIYVVYSSLSYYSEDGGLDLNEPYDEEMTFGEAIMSISQDEVLRLRSYMYGAKALGFTLSDEDTIMFADSLEGWKEEYGGEAGLLEAIWEQMGIKGLELFEFIITTNDLPYFIFNELYGDESELYSAEASLLYAEEMGLIMAKHILFLTEQPEELPEENSNSDLPDPHAKAIEILDQLNNYQGDDFEAFFDELMYEHSDDYEAFEMFPNGYLFADGDMMPEFYETAASLGIGEFSGLVETDYGYHIIYRRPIDINEIPFMYAVNSEFVTLRQLAASADFSGVLETWVSALNPVFTDEYRSIDIRELLARGS